jgi:hypothetical protein
VVPAAATRPDTKDVEDDAAGKRGTGTDPVERPSLPWGKVELPGAAPGHR